MIFQLKKSVCFLHVQRNILQECVKFVLLYYNGQKLSDKFHYTLECPFSTECFKYIPGVFRGPNTCLKKTFYI